MNEANDIQVGGAHYKSKYQHWDFVYDALGGRYLEGQLTKYIVRWRQKNGSEDIHKSRHYLAKLRELFAAGKVKPLNPALESPERSFALHSLQEFFQRNPVQAKERVIIYNLALWQTEDDLQRIDEVLVQLLEESLRQAAEPDARYVNQD